MIDAEKTPPEFARIRRAFWAVAGLSGVLLIGACDDAKGVLSSITGDDTATATTAPSKAGSGDSPNGAAQPAAPAAAAPMPAMSVAPIAAAVPPGAETGTNVGKKVRIVRADMQRLADNINLHNGDFQEIGATLSADMGSYRATIAALKARLQSGAAAGGPDPATQFRAAQNLLDRIDGTVAELGSLSAQIVSDAAFAAYTIEEIKAAFALRGASDEDKRQLKALRNVADADRAQIQKLSQAVASDYARRGAEMANQRRDLATLNVALKQRRAAPGPVATTTAAAMPAPVGQGRPLVTIRFDRPDVTYEQALYTALSRALERRPDARFELVAVSPSSGDAAQVTTYANEAKRNAQNVMRALSRMGLPAERLTLSAVTSAKVRHGEVEIFVR